MKMSDGGKGSSPRKQQDQEAYAANYEAIFGRKKKPSNDEVPLALRDWSYEEQLEKETQKHETNS
jgi:hypothetical protein